MPIDKVVQFRFSKGELDPRLTARSDLEAYQSSASEITNWWVISQGGVRRRPGLEYFASIRNALTQYPGGSITASDPNSRNTNSGTELAYLTNDTLTGENVYLTTTNISTIDPYVVFEYDLGSLQDVLFIDLFNLKVTSGTTDEFFVQKSDNGSTWTNLAGTLDFTNSISVVDTTERNYRLTVNDNIRYLRLVKIGGTDLSTAKAQLIEANVWLDDGSLGSDDRLARFEFDDSDSYLLVFSDNHLNIYTPSDNTLVAQVASPYTDAQLSRINYAQKDDVAVFTHLEVEPYQLIRQGSSDSLWSFKPIDAENIPKYEFVENDSNPATTMYVEAATGITKAIAGAAAFTDANDVGKYIHTNVGRGRILRFVSTTEVVIYVEEPFDRSGMSNTYASGEWTFEKGWEPLWSSARGYPQAVTFHFGRLVLGGFAGLPAAFAASVQDDYYDFNLNIQLATDAFFYEIASDKPDVIYHLNSHNDLEIFTYSSEYIIRSADDFTPSGVKVRRQTGDGSSPFIFPEEYQNGGTLFTQRTGSALLEFNYSETIDAYENQRLDVYSPHLIGNSPVDAALRNNTTNQQASYWLQINSDGNLVALAILKSQEVTGATECETDGLFKHVTTIVSTTDSVTSDINIYCIVQRTIDGNTVRYVEEMRFDNILDSALTMEDTDPRISSTTVSGLEHLEGESVRPIIDGSTYDTITVSSGSATLPTTVSETLEIGLDFTPNLVTNPVEDPLSVGPLMGNTKSIYEVNLHVYETVGITVNGYSPFNQTLSASASSSTIDDPPKEHTGRFRMTGFTGWDELGQLTITQSVPAKVTLLNLAIYFRYGK